MTQKIEKQVTPRRWLIALSLLSAAYPIGIGLAPNAWPAFAVSVGVLVILMAFALATIAHLKSGSVGLAVWHLIPIMAVSLLVGALAAMDAAPSAQAGLVENGLILVLLFGVFTTSLAVGIKGSNGDSVTPPQRIIFWLSMISFFVVVGTSFFSDIIGRYFSTDISMFVRRTRIAMGLAGLVVLIGFSLSDVSSFWKPMSNWLRERWEGQETAIRSKSWSESNVLLPFVLESWLVLVSLGFLFCYTVAAISAFLIALVRTFVRIVWSRAIGLALVMQVTLLACAWLGYRNVGLASAVSQWLGGGRHDVILLQNIGVGSVAVIGVAAASALACASNVGSYLARFNLILVSFISSLWMIVALIHVLSQFGPLFGLMTFANFGPVGVFFFAVPLAGALFVAWHWLAGDRSTSS